MWKSGKGEGCGRILTPRKFVNYTLLNICMHSDTGLNRAELQEDEIRSIAFLTEFKKNISTI